MNDSNDQQEINRLRQRLVEEREKTAMAAEAGQMLLQQRDVVQQKLEKLDTEFAIMESKYDSTAFEHSQTQERLEDETAALEQTKVKLKEAESKLMVHNLAPLQEDSQLVQDLELEVQKTKKNLKDSRVEVRELQREVDSLSAEISLQRETQNRVSVALSKADSKRKCDISALERKLIKSRDVVSESNTARENTAEEMARLSELTVSLKRKLLDAESESRSLVTIDGSNDTAEKNESFSPYLKRVLMLFAAQVSRLELDLEMAVKEREEEIGDQRSRSAVLFSASLWFFGIVALVLPEAAC